MKKLIAIAVVFALAAGGVFAGDVGATVFGGVRLFEGETGGDDNPINGSAGLDRLRLEGAGQNGDGTFGAWIRFEPTGGTNIGVGVDGSIAIPGDPEDPDDDGFDLPFSGSTGSFVAALVWWKPIDEFKLTIGSNPDGIWGKEGYAGWMFYQMPSDCGIVSPHSVWGGPYLNPWWSGEIKYRNAFFEGIGYNALMMEIKPADMVGINIGLPYFNGGPVSSIFKNAVIQLDFNLDFGNIALSFDLAPWTDWSVTDAEADNKIGGRIFAYFGLTSVDNLSLDIGIGFPLPQNTEFVKTQKPVAAGLAAKYDVNDAFGLKARLLAQFMGSRTVDMGSLGKVESKEPFALALDLLPYYAISDSMKAFFGLGITMMAPDEGDSVMGWHFNPYLQIGSEWSPCFYVGLRVWSYGNYQGYGKPAGEGDATINWEVPIGIQVSF
jgi:hypothetical protein